MAGAEERVVTTYPFAALLEKAGLETTSKAVRGLSISGASFNRYTEHGLTPEQADRLACRAGFHPAEVWPEWAADPFVGLHGKRSTYVKGCRCDECREVNRIEYAAWYAANRERKQAQIAAYREATKEHQKKANRRRYWSNPEAERERKRRERAAKKVSSHA